MVALALRQRQEIRHDGDRRRRTAGAGAAEAVLTAIMAADGDHVVRARVEPEVRAARHERRPDEGVKAVALRLDHGDLPDRAPKPSRVSEVGRRDRTDRSSWNVGQLEMPAERDAGQDHELRAGVVAVDVGAGIRLGVSEPPGVIEHSRHLRVATCHACSTRSSRCR